jgi:hypothetical protein
MHNADATMALSIMGISQSSFTCTFMDLTSTIAANKLSTTIYEKPQNLYMYFPLSSAHPNGQLHDLIFHRILQFYCLCINPPDAQHKTQQLYSRLLQCGYTPEHLLLLFTHAQFHAITYLSCSPEEQENFCQQKFLSSK